MSDRQSDGLLAAIAGFAFDGWNIDLKEALPWDEQLRSWGWTLAQGVAWIPHWAEDGTLTGVKTRTPVMQGDRLGEVRKASIGGSTFGALYGAWRGRRYGDVLLTEGETDCVWADRQAREQGLALDSYGLPFGAGSPARPALIAFLQGARVHTAFDPDEAGQRATIHWKEALEAAGIECRVCSFAPPTSSTCGPRPPTWPRWSRRPGD